MGWWVEEAWLQGPVILIARVFWVIASIVLHELGHGYAAIRRGDRTPIETGHMTLNPVVHMGPMSLLAFALLGFTWGAMPVSPYRFRGRYAEAFVAAAGPAVNAGLFVLCIGLAVLSAALGGLVGTNMQLNLVTFFYWGAVLNCLLLLFNLVPVPPLDGHRILGDFVPRFRAFWEQEQSAQIGLFAFLALLFFGSKYIWGAVMAITHGVLDPLLQPFGLTFG
jgi:Zn-dependent protease